VDTLEDALDTYEVRFGHGSAPSTITLSESQEEAAVDVLRDAVRCGTRLTDAVFFRAIGAGNTPPDATL